MDERRAVVASQPGVALAALELGPTASAVDRVLAAVLAAVAMSPGVLFGPLQILMAGGGLGSFAIDGRVRQPGRGAPRPRGFLERDEIPEAAWVAAPEVAAAGAASVAVVRTPTASRITAPAIERAKDRSEMRTKLLRAIGRRGAAALGERAFAEELVVAFGRTAGGLLTAEDLVSPDTEAVAAASRVPWLGDAPLSDATVHIVAAGDARGRFAVACYEDAGESGIELPVLDVVVPRLSEPVRRGEVRTRPGTPRPAAAPIGVHMDAGTVYAVLGRTGKAQRDDVDELLRRTTEVGWAVPAGVVGVRRTRQGAKGLGSA